MDQGREEEKNFDIGNTAGKLQASHTPSDAS
jgi:hypothetical protein